VSCEIISSAGLLKEVFKGVNLLVREAKLNFSEEELHIRAVDYSNTAMVVVNVPYYSFEAHNVNEETTVGVDISALYDYIKSAKKSDTITMSFEDSKIKLEINNRITYTISAIDPSAIRKEPKIPNLEHPAEVMLDIQHFKEAVNIVDKISDEVDIISDGEALIFKAFGDETRREELTITLKDELFDHNGGKAKSKFNLEFLKLFAKVNGDSMKIKLGDDYPGIFFFQLDGAEIYYILAPRIEVE